MMWLDSKYASLVGSQLDRFKKLRDNTWSFRCPICGDSRKDKTKTRGYLYPGKTSLRYKCHNCGAGMSFYDFLKDQDPQLFKEYKMEGFKERNAGRKTRKTAQHQKRKPALPKKRNPMDRFGMPTVSSLPEDHPACVYLRERKVPVRAWEHVYYVDEIGEVAHKLPGYEDTRFDQSPRIMFPFINRDGVVTHIQGRAIVPVDKSKRYVTLEIENEPKIFGMSRLRPGSSNILVVEGPIDSLFLPNCVAMGGADLSDCDLDPSSTIFVFDNEPRNREIIGRIEKVIARGYGVCIWGEEVVDKDINDMILSGQSARDLHAYILSHAYRGMKAKLQLTRYKNVD